MTIEIVMPKLSDTMEEGTILKWLKQVGDPISAGEVIAEVETDKADMELEASESGVLSKIQVPAGESAAVGAVIAVVDVTGAAAPKKVPTAVTSKTERDPVTAEHKLEPDPEAQGTSAVKVSAAARALAVERGVDLATLRGSGPGRQWSTPLSAAESNGPWTGSGLQTSASIEVTSSRCNLRDAYSRTFRFGSRRVTGRRSGMPARTRK